MADTTSASSVSNSTGIRSYEEYVRNSRKPGGELGKTDFLQLLAAQMQYQNPLEPVSDTQFVAQLAQFSSLEQMTNLNSTMTMFQYYSLAGKYVYAEVLMDDGTEAAVSGMVDRVVSTDGKAYVQVGEYMIDASKITQVYDKDLFNDSTLLQSTGLIGKMVKANTYDSIGDISGEVSGIVKRIAIEKNVLVAYLEGGERVAAGDIFDIGEAEIQEKSELVTADAGAGSAEGLQ